MDFWKKCNRRIGKVPCWPIGVLIGVVFLIIGFFDGQFTDIYRKAVVICLECIGIG